MLTIAQVSSFGIKNSRPLPGAASELPFDESLKPFYHGVASGDPTSDAVIIWTRYTPEGEPANVEVEWEVATDTAMKNIVKNGKMSTDASRDYTVKVDVTGLSAATTYYYHFISDEKYSLRGRTRTTPSAKADQLRFAVVSCNNYEHGYFNAFQAISKRNDLDAVLHLGDYIYEYEPGTYGAGLPDRTNVPAKEIITAKDYRTRYSLYRLDPDLRRAHQQHPFIAIWDDHESTNDSYRDGAENHDELTEGKWSDRVITSKQAYFEWMPVRENSEKNVHRVMSYGDLADLIMLDTRLEGREVQPTTFDEADIDKKKIMSDDQLSWFSNALTGSSAKWKVIGNQVIFSQLNVGFAAGFSDGTPDTDNLDSIRAVESIFLDIWDGYPGDRSKVLKVIADNSIDNVVILTGDFHSSFAFDVTETPAIYPSNAAFQYAPLPSPSYDPATGNGSRAVEFTVPSITSANFDENVGAFASNIFEQNFNKVQATILGVGDINYNPHMKYTDLDRHGYILLDLTETQAQANFYYVNKILEKDGTEYFDTALYVGDGNNYLMATDKESPGKAKQEIQAPDKPLKTTPTSAKGSSAPVIFAMYPNPTSGLIQLDYAMRQAGELSIELYNAQGKMVERLLSTSQPQGLHSLRMDLSKLDNGLYLCKLLYGTEQLTRTIYKR